MIYTSDLEANILRDAKNAMNDAIMYECHECYMHANNSFDKDTIEIFGKRTTSQFEQILGENCSNDADVH